MTDLKPEPTRVLIVDDEPPARIRLRQLLADLPAFHVVGEASHGEEALALCNELRPDIVLLVRHPCLRRADA